MAIANGIIGVFIKHRLDTSPCELNQAVLKTLNDDTVLKHWRKGKKVFEPLPESLQ